MSQRLFPIDIHLHKLSLESSKMKWQNVIDIICLEKQGSRRVRLLFLLLIHFSLFCFFFFTILLPSVSGRNYDKDGDLKEWWTPDSTQRFLELSKCIVDQYSNFSWDLANGFHVCLSIYLSVYLSITFTLHRFTSSRWSPRFFACVWSFPSSPYASVSTHVFCCLGNLQWCQVEQCSCYLQLRFFFCILKTDTCEF